MTTPLASFGRRGARVSLHDALDLRLTFRRREDAEAYLLTWKNDDGGMAALRSALRRCERGAPVANLSDDQVVRAVAVMLMGGTLVLTESAPPVPIATSFPVASPAASPSAAALAAALPTLAAVRPIVPLLDLLEEISIEGAKVLPEVMQTLDQLATSMDKIALATVSLEPAPDGVPAVGTSMSDATGSITTTLDEL